MTVALVLAAGAAAIAVAKVYEIGGPVSSAMLAGLLAFMLVHAVHAEDRA